MTATATLNWLLVQPDQPGQRVALDEDQDQLRAYRSRTWRAAGAKTIPEDGLAGTDWEVLSRHFHLAVYEWSVTEEMALNWMCLRGDRLFPLCGPVLIYKTDDRGVSVDLTERDAHELNEYIRLQRLGLQSDSRLLG